MTRQRALRCSYLHRHLFHPRVLPRKGCHWACIVLRKCPCLPRWSAQLISFVSPLPKVAFPLKTPVTSADPSQSAETPMLGLQSKESTGTSFTVTGTFRRDFRCPPRPLSTQVLPATGESNSNSIGPITLGEKCAGARSAGNPHAACEVAGAGNGVTVHPTRARRRKLRIQPREEPTDYRASPRPYQWLRGTWAGSCSARYVLTI